MVLDFWPAPARQSRVGQRGTKDKVYRQRRHSSVPFNNRVIIARHGQKYNAEVWNLPRRTRRPSRSGKVRSKIKKARQAAPPCLLRNSSPSRFGRVCLRHYCVSARSDGVGSVFTARAGRSARRHRPGRRRRSRRGRIQSSPGPSRAGFRGPRTAGPAPASRQIRTSPAPGGLPSGRP